MACSRDMFSFVAAVCVLAAHVAMADEETMRSRVRVAGIAELQSSGVVVSYGIEHVEPIGEVASVEYARISEISGLSEIEIRDIVALAVAHGVSEATILDVLQQFERSGMTGVALREFVRESLIVGITCEDMREILCIAHDGGIPMVVVNGIIALGPAEQIDTKVLDGLISLAMQNKMQASKLADIVALVKKRVGSRFDWVNPGVLSRAWVIREMAIEAEKRGENTDELWRQYWDFLTMGDATKE